MVMMTGEMTSSYHAFKKARRKMKCPCKGHERIIGSEGGNFTYNTFFSDRELFYCSMEAIIEITII
jgi:hypothetical protein